MIIELKTVFFIICVTHFLQIIVFYYQHKITSLKGPAWWLLWSASSFTGFVLLLFRGNPFFNSFIIAVQDPILLLGIISIYIGLAKFFENRVRHRVIISLYLFFVACHLFFYFVVDSIFIRAIMLNVSIVSGAFLSAYIIYKNKHVTNRITTNFNIALFIIHGAVFLWHAVIIITGAPFADLESNTVFNYVQYFDVLIISLLFTFGFIMMLNQKLRAYLSEAKNQSEMIFNLTPEAVLITKLDDGILVNLNEGFTRMYGHKSEEVLGRTTSDIELWSDLNERELFFEQLREKGHYDNRETIFLRKDKEPIYALLSARIITMNNIPYIISVTRNITDRKKAEEEIKEKNRELLRLNSEKEKLFSIIAHDLKSPFQGIIGNAEILSNEYNILSDEERIDCVRSIREMCINSYRLLENLLEWTMLQTGNMAFNPERFNLLVELNPTLSLLKQAALKKNILVNCDIDSLLFIIADKNMFLTIIRNLVSNSIKFTNRDGRIDIAAKQNNGAIEISVGDNGIGIEKESLDKLFTIDKNPSRRGTANEKGTGLGLALCMDMIEKHGGHIKVSSIAGKGTTFSFTIPA